MAHLKKIVFTTNSTPLIEESPQHFEDTKFETLPNPTTLVDQPLTYQELQPITFGSSHALSRP